MEFFQFIVREGKVFFTPINRTEKEIEKYFKYLNGEQDYPYINEGYINSDIYKMYMKLSAKLYVSIKFP